MSATRSGLGAAMFLLAAACGGDATSPEGGTSTMQEWRVTALAYWHVEYQDYSGAYNPYRTVCQAVASGGDSGTITLKFQRTGDRLVGTASFMPLACYEEWKSGESTGGPGYYMQGGPISGRFNGDSLLITGPVFELQAPWEIAGVISRSPHQIDVFTGSFCATGAGPEGCQNPTQLYGGAVAMMRID